MSDQTDRPANTTTIPSACEQLIEAINRRASVTYALNEIAKTNIKTVFTDAAKTHLKQEQAKSNEAIQRITKMLVYGHW